MATTKLSPVFDSIRGKLNKKDRIVHRQKKYRSENGAVISTASNEAYEIANPRDYKKNPPTAAELQNIRSFAEASRLTTLILRAAKLTDDELAAMPELERRQALDYRAQYARLRTRFAAQLKTPDPQAPILTKTDPQYNPNSSKIQRRRYRTLNTFIRAMLIANLRSEPESQKN